MLQVVHQFFSVLPVAAVIFFSGYLWQQLSSVKIVNAGFPWQATGERSFFSAGCVLSGLLADFQKGLEKIILERKKESMCSAC